MASDFEHLCSHIAIAQTSDRRSLVKDLVVQTFVSLAPYAPSDQTEIATDLKTLFSVPLDEIEIRSAIDQLTDDHVLQRTSCGTFAISTEKAVDVKTRIDGAHQLQEQLHALWNSFVSKNFPDLAPLDTFSILKTFFFSMFRRHGIRAAGLLYPPLVQVPGQAENSLTADLSSILHTDVPPQHRAQVREALLAFLRPSPEQPTVLPQYISRLSNAAYNFYSLQAPPEVAITLRSPSTARCIFGHQLFDGYSGSTR